MSAAASSSSSSSVSQDEIDLLDRLVKKFLNPAAQRVHCIGKMLMDAQASCDESVLAQSVDPEEFHHGSFDLIRVGEHDHGEVKLMQLQNESSFPSMRSRQILADMLQYCKPRFGFTNVRLEHGLDDLLDIFQLLHDTDIDARQCVIVAHSSFVERLHLQGTLEDRVFFFVSHAVIHVDEWCKPDELMIIPPGSIIINSVLPRWEGDEFCHELRHVKPVHWQSFNDKMTIYLANKPRLLDATFTGKL